MQKILEDQASVRWGILTTLCQRYEHPEKKAASSVYNLILGIVIKKNAKRLDKGSCLNYYIGNEIVLAGKQIFYEE